ncbi:hypothetical protein AAFH68_08780 [Flavobacterium sp. CGRL1]
MLLEKKKATKLKLKECMCILIIEKKGIASAILKELEIWAKEVGYTYTILETGKNQPEAINLYQKLNYTIIPNYPPYEEMDNSVCMKKTL